MSCGSEKILTSNNISVLMMTMCVMDVLLGAVVGLLCSLFVVFYSLVPAPPHLKRVYNRYFMFSNKFKKKVVFMTSIFVSIKLSISRPRRKLMMMRVPGVLLLGNYLTFLFFSEECTNWQLIQLN